MAMATRHGKRHLNVSGCLFLILVVFLHYPTFAAAPPLLVSGGYDVDDDDDAAANDEHGA